MNERFNKAIERVNNIVIQQGDDYVRKSLNYLLKEYIRRAALFLKYISKDYKYPFFRAADAITKEDIIDFDLLCPKMAKYNHRYITASCKHYVEWAALADKGETLALMFGDLYDPLILIIERGGELYMEHGILYVGRSGSIAMSDGIVKYASDVPYEISKDALDRYDAKK